MKKDTNPDIKVFIDYAFKTHMDATGTKLYIQGKCAKIIERMLNTFSLPELNELWDKFLVCDDEFVLSAGYSMSVFESQINKLQNGHKGRKTILDTLRGDRDFGKERDTKDHIIPLRRIS